jgi:hypothetical protein
VYGIILALHHPVRVAEEVQYPFCWHFRERAHLPTPQFKTWMRWKIQRVRRNEFSKMPN